MAPTIVADTFFQRHDHLLTALLSLVLTGVVVVVVNRAIDLRAREVATAVSGGKLSPVADTRLRFLRRIIDAAIIVIGAALALAQFTALDRLAGTVLASSAIAAAVIGFAARQTFANAIAGLLLAITQPLRIGDAVAFEGEYGTVEDVGLTYTWLRTGTDARVIIPNERLVAGILRNDSIVSPTVAVEASLWIAHDDDETGAVESLRAAFPDTTVRVADVTAEGTRLAIVGSPVSPGERIAAESELREAGLRALREAGVRRGAAPG
jgi:small conductance mechanosensitive channel